MRIRDVVERPEWEIRVLAGDEQLDREIRWIHPTDLLDPSPYLRGGELILTNGLWRVGPGDSARFVDALVASGVHALGYAVFERGTVPADLGYACRAAGLPLLELPNVPFMEIAEEVLEQLLRERPATARPGDELQARLEAAATPGELASVLASHLDRPVWICDRRGELLADADAAPSGARVAEAWLAAMATAGSGAPVAVPGDRPVTAVGVHRAGGGDDPPIAVLAVEAGADAAHEPLRRAARAAAALLAELPDRPAGRDAANATLRQLAEQSPGPAEVVALLAAHGFSPQPGAVVAVAAERLGGDAAADALTAACRLGGRDALVTAGDGAALAFVPRVTGDDDALGRSVLAFAQALSGAGGAVAVGRSRAVAGPAELPLRIAEARRALTHARRLPSPAIVGGDELGRSALLLAALDDELRAAFAATLLDPLLHYDREHASEMLRTLQVFLGSGGSWVESARTLHLHVNTLRYRISRIEELTGRSLSSVGDRVDFHLALVVADGEAVHRNQTANGSA